MQIQSCRESDASHPPKISARELAARGALLYNFSTMLRSLTALCLFAILASGCNDRRRPPFAGLGNERPSQPDAGNYVTLPSASGDSPCETVVEVPVVKPNFYFLLDTSGSMAERMPGSTLSRHRAAVDAIEQMLSVMQERVNFGAAVFPSSFNGASCDTGNEVFKLTEGSAKTTNRTPLQSIIATLLGFAPEGGSPVSATLAKLSSQLKSFSGETYVVLLTDGAPNCNRAEACSADQCILNLEGALFDDGSACDETRNCCAKEWFPHMCLDSAPTLAELKKLADAGVSTYVVGLPGGAAYSDLLNRMAEAGGTARHRTEGHPGAANDAGLLDAGDLQTDDAAPEEPENVPNDGLSYYQVNDAESLGSALAAVRRDVLVDCLLELDFAPSSAELVQVTAGGHALDRDEWRLVAAKRVELLGDVCEAWKSGTLSQVKVTQLCRGTVR